MSAKGSYLKADAIVKLAERYGIPIRERSDLAQALDQLPIDTEIPAELYEAVALLLMFTFLTWKAAVHKLFSAVRHILFLL